MDLPLPVDEMGAPALPAYVVADARPPLSRLGLSYVGPTTKSGLDLSFRLARKTPRLTVDTNLGQTLAFQQAGAAADFSGQPAFDLRSPKLQVNMSVMAISNHIGSRYPFNETNPGIGFDFRLSQKLGIAIGTYENSFNNGSTYLMGYVDQPLIKAFNRINFSGGAMLGVVSGYKKGLAPLFNWAVAVQDDVTGFGARILIIPSGEGMRRPVKLFDPKVVALQLLQNTYTVEGWNITFALSVNKRVPDGGMMSLLP